MTTIADFQSKHLDEKFTGGTIQHLLPGLFRDAVCLIGERLDKMIENDAKRLEQFERECKRAELADAKRDEQFALDAKRAEERDAKRAEVLERQLSEARRLIESVGQQRQQPAYAGNTSTPPSHGG